MCGTSPRLPRSLPCRIASPMSPACGRTMSSIRLAEVERSSREHLARIEPVVGVERSFDRAGELHLGRCAIARQLANAILADAMFRRDAAAEGRHHVVHDTVHEACVMVRIHENIVVDVAV